MFFFYFSLHVVSVIRRLSYRLIAIATYTEIIINRTDTVVACYYSSVYVQPSWY